MSDRLSVDDLADVQRKIYAVKTEWYNLGLELGLQVSTLDCIHIKYNGNPSHCFRQVLIEWLSRVDPPPTWQAMVRGLNSSTVAKYDVAEQVRTELLPAMQPLSSHPLLSSPSPQLLSPQTSTSAQPHSKSLEKKQRSRPAHHTAPTMKHYARLCSTPESGPSFDETVARQNYHMICFKFADLVRTASNRLQSVVSIDEFQLFVANLFPPGDCIPDSVSVHSIFHAITKNGLWDCVNYLPLKHVTEEFVGKDVQLTKLVKQYEEARSGYMLCTKISHHIGAVAASDSSDIDSDEQLEEKPAKYDARYYRRLSLKVRAAVTKMTMQYVSELWESLASHYCLPSLTTIFERDHADDCILVTLLVPTKQALQLIEEAHADPVFQEHNVLWATLDDDDLYNSKENL